MIKKICSVDTLVDTLLNYLSVILSTACAIIKPNERQENREWTQEKDANKAHKVMNTIFREMPIMHSMPNMMEMDEAKKRIEKETKNKEK